VDDWGFNPASVEALATVFVGAAAVFIGWRQVKVNDVVADLAERQGDRDAELHRLALERHEVETKPHLQIDPPVFAGTVAPNDAAAATVLVRNNGGVDAARVSCTIEANGQTMNAKATGDVPARAAVTFSFVGIDSLLAQRDPLVFIGPVKVRAVAADGTESAWTGG
jgi:hypothetical protein